MQSAKVIITLWVRQKKSVKLTITLRPEDVEDGQDAGGDTCDNYIRVEMSFNRLMTEFLEGSKTYKLTQHVFCAYQDRSEKTCEYLNVVLYWTGSCS